MTDTEYGAVDPDSRPDMGIDAVVASVRELLTGLRDDDGWVGVAESVVLERARSLEDLARLVDATRIVAAGVIHRHGLAERFGASSTAGLLREMLRIRPGEAHARVRAATVVLEEPQVSGHRFPPRLPELAASMWDGVVNAHHVEVIESTMRSLPPRVPANVRGTVERALVEQAGLTDPTHLADIARTIAILADPDGDLPPEQDPRKHPSLSLGRRDPFTGLTRITGHLDDEGVETLRQATDPLMAPPAPERAATVTDPDGHLPVARSVATRRAHALTEALHRALGAAVVGEHGGVRPHLTVTVGLDQLRAGRGLALLDHGGPVRAGEIRQLACDAGIVPAVLGGASEVLDVGREHRLVPLGLRRALAVRDRGCAFPGCDRPPGWCDAHHVRHWADGGPTSLENTVLYCRHHHTVLHAGHWVVRLGADGHPEHIPPVWVDPHQHPRRNRLHHHEPWRDRAEDPEGGR
ncbi:HNH endonuclease signature motif containing protein [Nakamurella leprariae]|uniref:DUF222 domain-containing protein n=1 Tax=Nakamurella leprariae TaxID=2803911 RepID=A0A938YI43_9ACTN|nr:HNH endonuclease signature motif containing protein [Nakamurella leprariae]MBM9468258.1 DUF222 domain-containing protein [Nakamurella leprariae]